MPAVAPLSVASVARAQEAIELAINGGPPCTLRTYYHDFCSEASSSGSFVDIFFMQRRALHAVHVFQLAEALCLKMNVNDDTSSKGMRAASSGYIYILNE